MGSLQVDLEALKVSYLRPRLDGLQERQKVWESAIGAASGEVSRLKFVLFVRENCTFRVCGNEFRAKIAIFDEKTQKNLVMSKKSCTFAPAFEKEQHGGLSSVGRASDCGSECQGFEPLIPPA